jgi:hypothetical protein
MMNHQNRIRAQAGQPPLELGDFISRMTAPSK